MTFNKFLSLNSRFIALSSMIWCIFIFFSFSLLLSLFGAAVNMSVYELFQHRYLLPYMRGYSICDFPFNQGCFYNLFRYFRSDGCFHFIINLKHGGGVCCPLNNRRSANNNKWKPEIVDLPGEIDRDKELCENLFENRLYSCC